MPAAALGGPNKFAMTANMPAGAFLGPKESLKMEIPNCYVASK